MSSLPSEPRAAAAEPQADARTAEVGIERLPGSLLQNIFGFLDAASVRQAAAVSQTWSGLAHDLDNVLYDRARAERELEAMRRRFQNDGFRESVDEAREVSCSYSRPTNPKRGTRVIPRPPIAVDGFEKLGCLEGCVVV